jgi:tRNA nucleotidyltransferase/poly(A) polymerase
MAKHGPNIDSTDLVTRLLNIGKYIEPGTEKMEQTAKEYLRPYHALAKKQTFVVYALQRLIHLLETIPSTEVRNDTLALLTLCIERVNQTYFFLQCFATPLNAKDVQHQKLMRFLINDLTNCVYLYSTIFEANTAFLEQKPEYYTRNKKYKHLLEKTFIRYGFFSTFLLENPQLFPSSMVAIFKQKKEHAPLLILQSEISFLRVERHLSFAENDLKTRAHQLHCNNQLKQILARKKLLTHVPNTPTYRDLESLALEITIPPLISNYLSQLYEKKIEFERILPIVTIRCLMAKNASAQSELNSAFSALDSIKSRAEAYLSLPEETRPQILMQHEFYQQIISAFDTFLVLNKISQNAHFIIFLDKMQALCASWLNLFKAMNLPICFSLGYEFYSINQHCVEAKGFLETQQRFLSLTSPTDNFSANVLIQQLQGLFITPPTTIDLMQSTRSIMNFAANIPPNRKGDEVRDFMSNYRELLKHPDFVEQTLVATDEFLIQKNDSSTLQPSQNPARYELYNAHKQRLAEILQRINVVYFVLQNIARPLDVTHALHHKFIFRLISDLTFSLNAYNGYYLINDIPPDECEAVFAQLSIYKLILDRFMGHYKHFASYAVKHSHRFPPDYVNLVKENAVYFYKQALKINFDWIRILQKRDSMAQTGHDVIIFEILFAEIEANAPVLCKLASFEMSELRAWLNKLNERAQRQIPQPSELINAGIQLCVNLHDCVLHLRNTIADRQALSSLVPPQHEVTNKTQLQRVEDAFAFITQLSKLHSINPDSNSKLSPDLVAFIQSTFDLISEIDGMSIQFIIEKYLSKVAGLCFNWMKFLDNNTSDPILKNVYNTFEDCSSYCMDILNLVKKKSATASTRVIIGASNGSSAAAAAAAVMPPVPPSASTAVAPIEATAPEEKKRHKRKNKKQKNKLTRAESITPSCPIVSVPVATDRIVEAESMPNKAVAAPLEMEATSKPASPVANTTVALEPSAPTHKAKPISPSTAPIVKAVAKAKPMPPKAASKPEAAPVVKAEAKAKPMPPKAVPIPDAAPVVKAAAKAKPMPPNAAPKPKPMPPVKAAAKLEGAPAVKMAAKPKAIPTLKTPAKPIPHLLAKTAQKPTSKTGVKAPVRYKPKIKKHPIPPNRWDNDNPLAPRLRPVIRVIEPPASTAAAITQPEIPLAPEQILVELTQKIEHLSLHENLHLPAPIAGIKLEVPPLAKHLLEKLHAAGRWAFIAGGFPRDELSLIPFQDVDIITFGRREEILAILGIGTISFCTSELIHISQEGIEIDIVCTEKPLEKTVFERDFTVNTLLCTNHGEIIDILNAINDLNCPHLKLIPGIEADPLQFSTIILRAVRMSTSLDKTLLPETIALMQQHAPKIQDLPLGVYLTNIERLFLRGKAETHFTLLQSLGIYTHLFPSTLLYARGPIAPYISAFLLRKFKEIDCQLEGTQKGLYTKYDIMALLLLPELMTGNPTTKDIDIRATATLKAFCQIKENDPYDPAKVSFQKATASLLVKYFKELNPTVTQTCDPRMFVPVPFPVIFYYPVFIGQGTPAAAAAATTSDPNVIAPGASPRETPLLNYPTRNSRPPPP